VPNQATQNHVVQHPLPGQQTRVLKHDARIPVLPALLARIARIDQQLPRTGLFQPCHKAQQGGLAAAAAPNDGDELAGLNIELHLLEHFTLAIALGQLPRLQMHALRALGLLFLLRVWPLAAVLFASSALCHSWPLACKASASSQDASHATSG
jgi:hypothetical protein